MKIGEIVRDEELMHQEVDRRVDEWMRPENIRMEYF
jgi:hypothetical protein